MTDSAWIAPGPGEWTRLADHFDRPFTAEYERIFAASFEAGMEAFAEAVGTAGSHRSVAHRPRLPVPPPGAFDGTRHGVGSAARRLVAPRSLGAGVPAPQSRRRGSAAGATLA